MSEKSWKRIKRIILIACALAAIKLIFVDYTMDEEYQIVMSYRRIFGDTLFGTMWEPHQTSSFFCTLLMRPFIAITGSCEWIVVYLRICTTVIQLLLSLWIYKAASGIIDRRHAFLIAVCYFNLVPKLIQIPEFANLQLWFFTVILLALRCYYAGNRRTRWIVIAGVAMSLEVLSYPACLILFPFFCFVLIKFANPGKRLRDMLLFGGVCMICAVLWLFVVLSEVTPGEFLQNLQYLLRFDATHDLTGTSHTKLWFILGELQGILINLGLSYLLGFGGLFLYKRRIRKRKDEEPASYGTIAATFVLLAAMAIQFVYWGVLLRGYERPQILSLVLLTLVPLVCREVQEAKRTILVSVLGTILVMAGVLYMSDLGISNALAHAILGALITLLFLVKALEQRGEKGKKLAALLLVSLTLVLIFGKGFTLKMGRTETNSVLGIGNVVKHGPAKGILTNYMLGYIINCDYEDFTSYLEPGDKCLVVTTLVNTAGTCPYMFEDYEICHFSIVDPTTYDERLLTYWKQYPEKQPEVIAVDCWYGHPEVDRDSWIMQYIENEFGYTEMKDGKYMRFYKR